MNLNTHENLLKKSIIKWMQKCLLLKRLVDTGNYSFRTYNPLVLCILLLLGGCVSTSDVLELGKDSYTVSATSDGFRSAANAREDAFAAGAEKCHEQSKKYMLTNENASMTRMGIDTTVTIYFRCLDEADIGYSRPNLQKHLT
jgi:hypothetical protein